MRNNQVTNNKALLRVAGGMTVTHLFGYQPGEQLPATETLQRTEGHTAVYPAFEGAAFARTMDNFRQYVSAYNFQTIAENELIDKHNAAVQIYKKENQLAEYQLTILRNFPKRFARCNAREYNAEVDNAGEAYSCFIEKKRIQTIKYTTEQVFQHFLHMYNIQLRKRNDEYKRLKVRVPGPLPQLDTNSFHMTTLRRNGVASIDVCSKTVRNHRNRLVEAGVFSEVLQHGHSKGATVTVKPEILAVLDLHTNKVAILENQPLTPCCEKNLPNKEDTTRTSLEEYKIREAAPQASDDKESAKPTAFVYKSIFYKNTLGNVQNFTGGAAPENVKKDEKITNYLRSQVIPAQQLAIELANGVHDNYIPIDIRLLHSEAMGGMMPREEFRELMIQDFFKNAAKMWRGATVYPGTWKKAINMWMDKKWMTFNGFAFQKHNIIDDIAQLRWRLENARRWFVRTGVPPLYPSNYFDFTRTTAKEIGFEYTKKRWERHLKHKEEEPGRKAKIEKNAALRKESLKHSKKFEDIINRFLKNRITWPQLADYVANNLPPEFGEKLPETLDRMMANPKF